MAANRDNNIILLNDYYTIYCLIREIWSNIVAVLYLDPSSHYQ